MSYEYGIDENFDVGPTGPTSPLKVGAVLVDHIAICSGHYNQKALDVKNQCTNVTIFEDISKYHLSGRLTVIDGLDVIKNMKLVGQETVTIKLRLPSDSGDFDEEVKSVCPFCGVGCQVSIKVKNEKIK